MPRNDDYRENKDGDDTDFIPKRDDEDVLGMEGENPLAEEESVKVDDSASD